MLCEDEADKQNPRNLVTKVFGKEVEDIHKGERDLEIHDAVTSRPSQKAGGIDVEQALLGVSWGKDPALPCCPSIAPQDKARKR